MRGAEQQMTMAGLAFAAGGIAFVLLFVRFIRQSPNPIWMAIYTAYGFATIEAFAYAALSQSLGWFVTAISLFLGLALILLPITFLLAHRAGVRMPWHPPPVD